MVLVRSVRTTGAVPSVTAAAAAGWAGRQGGPLSTIPAATPATTTGAATAAARRRRLRWAPARSAVIAQARQRRGADLGVQDCPARVRGRLVGGIGFPAGRYLAAREAEPVAGRVAGLGGRVIDVRQAVCAQALRRAHPGLDQLRRRGRLGVRDQAGLGGQRGAGLPDGVEHRLRRVLDAAGVGVDLAAGGQHRVGVGGNPVLPDALRRRVQRGGTGAGRALALLAGGLAERGHPGRAGGRAPATGQQQGAGQAGDDVAVSHLNLPDRVGSSCTHRPVTRALHERVAPGWAGRGRAAPTWAVAGRPAAAAGAGRPGLLCPCHAGRRTIKTCGYWWSRIRRCWPIASRRACGTRAWRSTPPTTARRRWRSPRSPRTT